MFGAYRSVMETQLQTGRPGSGPLGLSSVLASSLPAALMTADTPDRYTVEAVFTRRPERDEIIGILGDETRELLVRSGYPTVELTISDRRLEIANTNLEELRDGLARVLADRLAEISAGMYASQEAAAVRFQDAAESEQARAAAVVALAESVIFRPSEGFAPSTSESVRTEQASSDRGQIDDWTDEGGHGR